MCLALNSKELACRVGLAKVAGAHAQANNAGKVKYIEMAAMIRTAQTLTTLLVNRMRNNDEKALHLYTNLRSAQVSMQYPVRRDTTLQMKGCHEASRQHG